MSTQQNKKPKICKLDQQTPSPATQDHHLQTIQTPTLQQNRSQNEFGKTCNEQRNRYRNIIALSAPQADCPPPSPQLNRKSNPGKHSHTPTILTIHIPSNTDHMAESSASLLHANHITMPHSQPTLQTNSTQAQGKPPQNITNPTTPASSINNQIEEYTVPPSPPTHSINRHKGHRNKIALPAPQADCPPPHPHPNRDNNPAQGKHIQNNKKPTTPASSINNQIEEYTVPPSPPIHTIARKEPPLTSEPTPKPQAVGQAIPNVAPPLDPFYTEDITPLPCRLTSNHYITKQPQVPQPPANTKTDHSIRSNDDMHFPLTDCNMPNPDQVHSDGPMSTQKNKKPKICQLGHPNQSPATKDPHLQTTQTPNPQQNRSPNETGKTRNEHRKGHRNKIALSAPQADNPSPSSHLNRNSNQGKPSHAPTNLTILVPSIINHIFLQKLKH